MSIFNGNGTFTGSGDTISFMVILSTFMDWLPPLSALLSIVWLLIRIYETKTVQCWLNCNKKMDEPDAPPR